MGSFSEVREWTSVVLVGHEIGDFDCFLSMSLVVQALADLGFHGRIHFVFVLVGETYKPSGSTRMVDVSQDHWYEDVGCGEAAIHVDVGKSALDHHSPSHPAPSSASLVDQFFGVSQKHLEWRGLVKAADLAEQGQLKGAVNINGILDGQHRLLGPKKDEVIFRLFARLLSGLLENAKVGIEGRRVAPELLRQFQFVEAAPEKQIVKVGKFGRVGLIIASLEKLGCLGPMRSEMEQRGCRLVISNCGDRTAIMSCMPSAQNRHIDLAEWGIVPEIRRAEAEKLGLEMAEADFVAMLTAIGYAGRWMAHQVVDPGADSPRIANLFNGTSKTPPPEGQQTVLSIEEVVRIVLHCLLAKPLRLMDEVDEVGQ